MDEIINSLSVLLRRVVRVKSFQRGNVASLSLLRRDQITKLNAAQLSVELSWVL